MNKITSEHYSVAGGVTAASSELRAVFDIIRSGASQRDLERSHPHEAMAMIRQIRLGALRIPAADGGGGSSFRDLFDVIIRLAQADSNVAHILRNHFSFVERFAREPRDTKGRKWQRAVLGGAIVGLANTELGAARVGAVPFATTLTPDADGFRLTGKKYYSTGALYSDLVLVRATAPGGSSASAVIPVDREGVKLLDDWDGSGQRLTGTGTSLFDNVRVEPDEVVVDAPGVGYGILYGSTLPQLYLTAINAGILRAILADATALVRRRDRSFYFAAAEKPAADPLLQEAIGQIASDAFAAQSAVLAAADAQDALSTARSNGEPDEALAHHGALLAAQAKVLVDELVLRSAARLFDVGGASATKRSHNLDRHWRNARTLASHNPAAYKARAIGDYELNGTPLPTKGFF